MIDRKKIRKCPICGSRSVEHRLGDHKSRLRGTATNVPQTVCHGCGEVFFGPDSLEVIRSQAAELAHVGPGVIAEDSVEYNSQSEK